MSLKINVVAPLCLLLVFLFPSLGQSYPTLSVPQLVQLIKNQSSSSKQDCRIKKIEELSDGPVSVLLKLKSKKEGRQRLVLDRPFEMSKKNAALESYTKTEMKRGLNCFYTDIFNKCTKTIKTTTFEIEGLKKIKSIRFKEVRELGYNDQPDVIYERKVLKDYRCQF